MRRTSAGRKRTSTPGKSCQAGRPVGKVPVLGSKDRETKQVAARVIGSTDHPTLRGFVDEHADPQAMVYTDGSSAFQGPGPARGGEALGGRVRV